MYVEIDSSRSSFVVTIPSHPFVTEVAEVTEFLGFAEVKVTEFLGFAEVIDSVLLYSSSERA